jgi:ABC-2 type transport system ATP-binding protein
MELNIDRLTKVFDSKIAVDQLSIKLSKGVYGLLGENGAGKTTLLRMICGVLDPTQGSIDYDGIDVNEERYRDILGYLPQKFGYYPNFTSKKFLLYMASLKGLNKYHAHTKTNELLSLMSLEKVAHKKLKTFSGGMLQRLGIAQALLNDPKILVLDEPTAGLDPKERINFRNLISKLGNDRIVLLSTHIVSDIEHIANKILFMKKGNIIQQGSPVEVLKAIENNVYECKCNKIETELLINRYPIINIRQEQQFTFLRLVSDHKPIESAIGVPSTLEDLYLYYFSEVIEDENIN